MIKKAFFLLLILGGFLSAFPFEERTDDLSKKKEKEPIFRPHEEIVVTATMTRKAVKDCSSSVSVVSDNDLKAIAASNALNILNHLPGIFISRTGDFGRADVNIRGLGERGRKIALLVDGRPEKMSLFGCLVTHTFPLDNVERIEVVRGPSSVLYGSDALGGVVNILTRMPDEGFETDFTVSYGSFDTKQLNLCHGGNLDKFSYFFTLDRRSSDGHRENSDYSGNAFTGKIKYDLTDNFQASFQGKYFKGKKYEAGPVDLPLDDFWNDYERGAVDFSLRGKWQKDEIFLKLYRNFGHHQFSDGWHSRDNINGGVFRYTNHRIVNNEFTLGVDFRFMKGKSYNWPEGSWEKSEAAVFLYDQYVLRENWILSVGVRLHRDSLYGYELCPHWGIVFRVTEKTLLRGTISKGFRSPQLNELFIFPPANPDLEPERVWNYEIGFEQRIGNWLTLNGALFHMKGTNLIETCSNPFPPPLFRYQNIGEYEFTGAELTLHSNISQNLSWYLFYTYLDPGERTKGRPGQKLDLSLRFRQKSFYVSLNAQYVTDYFADDFSSNPLPSYFILNSRFIIDISPALELFLDVNNLFNKDYMIYVDLPSLAAGAYPMPGRNLNFGIRIRY